MCNATNRTLLTAIAASALIISSCSKPNPDKEAADELLTRIEASMSASDYVQALALMDSVDKLYPAQIDQRKQVKAMRPKAIEMATMQQMARADSIIAVSQQELMDLAPLFKHISGGDLDGYYVVADAYDPKFIDGTGVEARVNANDYTYYIVAQVKGKRIGANQVSLVTSASEYQSEAMPAESERTIEVEGSELATFLPEEVGALGQWAADNAADIRGAMIYGHNGHQQVKLNAKQAAAFGKAWRYADLKQRERSARILREKLDRKLQIARDQIANTMTIDE